MTKVQVDIPVKKIDWLVVLVCLCGIVFFFINGSCLGEFSNLLKQHATSFVEAVSNAGGVSVLAMVDFGLAGLCFVLVILHLFDDEYKFDEKKTVECDFQPWVFYDRPKKSGRPAHARSRKKI